MPLKEGSSKKTFSKNVKELLHSYHKGGKFAKGQNEETARKMALRIAFDIKKKGKKKK